MQPDPASSPDPRTARVRDPVDAVGALVLLMFVPSLLAGFLIGTDSTGVVRTEDKALAQVASVVLLLCYALVRRGLPVRLRIGRPLALYGLYMVAWMPFAMVLYPYIVRAFGHEFPAQEVVVYLAGDSGERLWLLVLLACVGAPIAEEIVFRGYLFRAVENAYGPITALIATSLLFGATHEPAVWVPITLLGFLFGYLRLKTGGIGSAILIHMVHNTWTVVAILFNPELVDLVYDK